MTLVKQIELRMENVRDKKTKIMRMYQEAWNENNSSKMQELDKEFEKCNGELNAYADILEIIR